MVDQRWVPQNPREELVLDVMRSLRAFSDAMDHMHGGIRGEMDMNASDLAALRMLIVREGRGELVSPHDIARHLAISTASTTKLLDRLTASGHLVRQPHPHDGRSRVVVLSEGARVDFYRHFGERMRRMREAMVSYTDDELRTIARFLGDMELVVGDSSSRDRAEV
ncbi:MarR family winged helix-turn-helix transcriptional regulator [Microbacterium sp.]|uniref:MarR family winged helix-turn-helix transcriptional regulator n=1 Tax=Microbacterium sp. TaxID=51671 RepID=UPI0039E4A8DE